MLHKYCKYLPLTQNNPEYKMELILKCTQSLFWCMNLTTSYNCVTVWLRSPPSMSLLTITRQVTFSGEIWSAWSAKIPRERAQIKIPWWHRSLITCKEQSLLTTGEGQKMSGIYCFLITTHWAEFWADCSSRALLTKTHLFSTIPRKSVSFREHREAP